ncbi:WecB/TagA/CpsF family glycosyltransferase [Paenibacillus hodogayensis]|uniref:N-acetylglucosaminyldiphosphoundecaprenol N-acetyl-beta-D-mannosaminyltransferase n=1 Tax=Paenibacillus hodogayensis TaxID=279208 RepID=A0ABV5W5G9_9BACL
MNNHAQIMGISFPKMTMDQSLHLLEDVVGQNRKELFYVVTGNPEIVMSCQHDRKLRSIVEEAGLVTADGIGIVMVSRLRGGHLPERVTGCDLLIQLLEKGNRHSWSFYLLGADEPTSRRAAEVIGERYPGVRVAGRHHGYFHKDDEAAIVEDIRAAAPDFLIVALGAPYAENWIHNYKAHLGAKVAIGVGGSLDIVAGKVKRAPAVWQKLHAEWLYRLIRQPSRWRRQLLLPRFALRALLYKD